MKGASNHQYNKRVKPNCCPELGEAEKEERDTSHLAATTIFGAKRPRACSLILVMFKMSWISFLLCQQNPSFFIFFHKEVYMNKFECIVMAICFSLLKPMQVIVLITSYQP